LLIKKKEDELKLLQDNITNLNQAIESLQLKYDKEVAEHQRLSNELNKINNESKVQISEKSSLERQVN
jgi:allophanate hydrolase subunit 1